MSGSEVARLPKPQLRGLLQSAIKTNIIVALGLTVISGVAFKFLYCEPHKMVYANFYKNYDPYKDFERMKKLGVLPSASDE